MRLSFTFISCQSLFRAKATTSYHLSMRWDGPLDPRSDTSGIRSTAASLARRPRTEAPPLSPLPSDRGVTPGRRFLLGVFVLSNADNSVSRELKMDYRVRAVLCLIESDKSIRVSELAERVNLSPNHLEVLFKAEVGACIKAHQRRLRLEEAADLLRDSFLNVSEIAYRVGFAEASHFSKTFKSCFGITPTEFRKRMEDEI